MMKRTGAREEGDREEGWEKRRRKRGGMEEQ